MRKTSTSTRMSNVTVNAITNNILFHYWNASEWEFSINHEGIDEKTANRYLALATMLTETFAPLGVEAKRLPEFASMCREVFAL